MPVSSKIPFVFFGSSRLSVIVLDQLLSLGYCPSLVVTLPAQLVGRKQILTQNIVTDWAKSHMVPCYEPEKLDRTFMEIFRTNKLVMEAPFFLVASYSKIIPEEIIAMPTRGVLNIHPSLLPKYRGPAPMPTAMIDDDKNTGVTIMLLDEKMDHGPIVTQKEITISEWPIYEDFEEMMAKEGAILLAENLENWITGKITARAQDHSRATFTKKITKEDGLLQPGDEPYLNFRKIQAYHGWPQAYFLHQSKDRLFRVKVTAASFRDGSLQLIKVLPEGGKAMSYADFVNGYGPADITESV